MEPSSGNNPVPMGETEEPFSGASLRIFLLIGCVYIALRLFRLDAFGLWYDETFSLGLVRQEWNALLTATAKDLVHPPLYYVILKIWVAIGGESLRWLRLCSVATAVATLYPFYLLCRQLRLRAIEIHTTLALIAVNTYLITYAQEVRMYSLFLLFTISSLYLYLRFTEEGTYRRLIVLFFVNTLLVYTHYFGWLVVISELAGLLPTRRRLLLRFFIGMLVTGLLFTPWALMAFKAYLEIGSLSQNVAWIPKPLLIDVLWYFAQLHGVPTMKPVGIAAGFILFAGSLLFWFLQWVKGKRDSQTATLGWLVLFTFAPILIMVAASYIFTYSWWWDRYAICAALPYLLLVSVACQRILSPLPRNCLTVVLIGWASVAAAIDIYNGDAKDDYVAIAGTIKAASAHIGEQKPTLYILGSDFNLAMHGNPIRYMSEGQFEVKKINSKYEPNDRFYWILFPNKPCQQIKRKNGCTDGEKITFSRRKRQGCNESWSYLTLVPVTCVDSELSLDKKEPEDGMRHEAVHLWPKTPGDVYTVIQRPPGDTSNACCVMVTIGAWEYEAPIHSPAGFKGIVLHLSNFGSTEQHQLKISTSWNIVTPPYQGNYPAWATKESGYKLENW